MGSPPPLPGRLIVGNLDAEVELAGSPPLPRAVACLISAAASTLSVFGRPGDRLWTPRPVAADRVPGARVELVSGPLDEVEPADEVIAWCETPSVTRRRLGQAPRDPGVVRRCNHRQFGLEVARQLGVALPGARMIDDAAEVGGDAWVVKAPLSAAGRDRVIGRGEPTAEQRTRIERLLEGGPLLWEPWVDRICDAGVVGRVTEDGHDVEPPHALLVDGRGAFRGIGVGETELTNDEEHELGRVAESVAVALRDAGYRGPFGIDAFAYRDARGERRLAPLGEINARMTFGHVAHAHARGRRCTFHLRPGGRREEPPKDATMLLHPAPPDNLTAWLAWGRPPRRP